MEIELKPTDIIMVIGIRGSGKTVLTKDVLYKFQDARHHVYVWDPMDEYPEFSRTVPKDASLEEFEELAERVYREGNMILCVEEVDMICNSSLIGPNFKRLINQGRHKKVGLVLTTRRIADVHKTPPSQAHHFFIFQTIIPNDVRYLQAFIGDAAQELPGLEDYHYLYWHKKTATICEPVNPER